MHPMRIADRGGTAPFCLGAAQTKVREVLIRGMMFADDAAVVAHTQEELQSLMDCFSQACKDFGLTISLKKTNVPGQDTETPPVITIDDYELDAVCQFTYLGSTTTATSLWTQRSTRGLGRQLQLSPVAQLECGHAPSCL